MKTRVRFTCPLCSRHRYVLSAADCDEQRKPLRLCRGLGCMFAWTAKQDARYLKPVAVKGRK